MIYAPLKMETGESKKRKKKEEEEYWASMSGPVIVKKIDMKEEDAQS